MGTPAADEYRHRVGEPAQLTLVCHFQFYLSTFSALRSKLQAFTFVAVEHSGRQTCKYWRLYFEAFSPLDSCSQGGPMANLRGIIFQSTPPGLRASQFIFGDSDAGMGALRGYEMECNITINSRGNRSCLKVWLQRYWIRCNVRSLF